MTYISSIHIYSIYTAEKRFASTTMYCRSINSYDLVFPFVHPIRAQCSQKCIQHLHRITWMNRLGMLILVIYGIGNALIEVLCVFFFVMVINVQKNI